MTTNSSLTTITYISPVRQRKYEPCAQGLSRWARWVLIDGALAKQ